LSDEAGSVLVDFFYLLVKLPIVQSAPTVQPHDLGALVGLPFQQASKAAEPFPVLGTVVGFVAHPRLQPLNHHAGLAQELQNVPPHHLLQRLAPHRLGRAAFAVRAVQPAGSLVAIASVVELLLAARALVRNSDERQTAARALHQAAEQVLIAGVANAEKEVGVQVLLRLTPGLFVHDGRHWARDGSPILGSRALAVLVDALVGAADDQVPHSCRSPQPRGPLLALPSEHQPVIPLIGAGHA